MAVEGPADALAGGGQSGFVLAGRSSREVERRETQTASLAALFWVVSPGATLLVAAAAMRAERAAGSRCP